MILSARLLLIEALKFLTLEVFNISSLCKLKYTARAVAGTE